MLWIYMRTVRPISNYEYPQTVPAFYTRSGLDFLVFFRKLLTAVERSDRCHSFITVMMNNTLYTIYLSPFSSSFALGIKR
jgi:hypothetical protein